MNFELASIIHALNMWRHYLLIRKFVLMSDYSGLRCPFDQMNLNGRKYIWLDTLSEFEFEIMYIKGKEKRVANSLSRKVQLNYVSIVSSYGTDLHDQIL